MTRLRFIKLCLLIVFIIGFKTAWSSGINFNDTTSPAPTSNNGNFGFGTFSPQTKLAVVGGNVGIGTWTAAAALDTNGFRLSTSPSDGYVLVSGSTGIGTWMAASTLATSGGAGSPGGSSSQLQYNNGGSFDGIANSNVTASGNVGLGTTLSTNKFGVSGSVGIGSAYAGYYTATSNGLIVEGNVGVGTYLSAATLNVVRSDTSDVSVLIDQNKSATGLSAILDLKSQRGNVGLRLMSYAFGSNYIQSAGYSAGNASLIFTGISGGTGSYYLINFANTTIGSTSLSSSKAWVVGNLAVGSSSSLSPSNGLGVAGNVGIGTTLSTNKLDVQGSVGIGSAYAGYYTATSNGLIVQGNLGIGTFAPTQALDVNGNISTSGSGLSYFSGNVGMGSTSPGTALDVAGTMRTTSFQLSTTPSSGYVLVSGSTGIGTWMSAGTLATSGGSSQWTTVNTNDVYLPSNGNVGLGTTITAQAALSIMNGNVGIGTFAPTQALEVNGKIATSGTGDTYFLSNVGVGSAAPGSLLDVAGTTRTTGFQLSTTPSSGFVLVSGSTGIGTWMAATTLPSSGGGSPGGSVSQLQYNNAGSFGGVANGAVDSNGNIGIGTVNTQNTVQVLGNIGIGTILYSSFLSTAAPRGGMLIEGSVGIGTLAPSGLLDVNGGSTASRILLKSGRGSVSASAGYGSYLSLYAGGPSGSGAIATLNAGDGNNGNSGGDLTVTGGSYQGGSGHGGYAILKGIKKNLNLGGDVVINGGWYSSGYGDVFVSPYGGNLGVGTVTASSKLVLVGGVGIGTGINSSYVNATAPNGQLIIEGNLGIGTTAPQYKLSVVGGNVGIGTAASFSNLQVGNLITTTSEFDYGTQGSGFTLDWNRGNKQKVTMSASYTITMTPPTTGVANLLLKVVQDGTGGWTPTLSGGSGVKWVGSAAPTFTAAASSTDIVTCYYDGAFYWCTASLNFGP